MIGIIVPKRDSTKLQKRRIIAKISDYVVGFIPDSVTSNGTNSTLKYAKKFNKKTIIIN